MKKFFLFTATLLLSACVAIPAPQPTGTTALPYLTLAEDNPYAPQPGDTNLHIAGVTISSIRLIERFDLSPVRVEVDFSGSVPSVCNELRIKVNPPNEKYQVFLDIYSLVNSNINCDNVFQQFETSVLLGLYSPGRFTVWVNGGLVGDFVSD